MKMQKWLLTMATAAALGLGANYCVAQNNNPPGGGGGGGGGGRGNFDPAQMRERMMERYKEVLEVNNDDEWKALQPLVEKVTEARMQSMAGMGRGMFGGPRRGGNDANAGGGGGGGGGRRGFGPAPSPEAEALQKAIDAKAPKAEVKAALDKYVAARKTKQADLEKAQDDLRKVLTARQEAIATLNGLL